MYEGFWNHIFLVKKLYDQTLEPVCRQHGITRMEMDILLFLANNPKYDTAADMVERRHLAKSHVSGAVGQLEKGGYLRRVYLPGNRKTAHLKLLTHARNVVVDGRKAQRDFYKAMFHGFSEEEKAELEKTFVRLSGNIQNALLEESRCLN